MVLAESKRDRQGDDYVRSQDDAWSQDPSLTYSGFVFIGDPLYAIDRLIGWAYTDRSLIQMADMRADAEIMDLLKKKQPKVEIEMEDAEEAGEVIP